MRAFSGASLASAAMVALSISAGCSQVSQVQAKRSFKAANAAYQAQDYKKSAALYEETLQEDPSISAAHFFLANSLDNQYKPSRRGEAANDELMTKAVENYRLGAEKLAGSTVESERNLAKLSLEYLVAAYGVDNPRHFCAGRKRKRGLNLILSANLQHIEEVQRHGMIADPHLPRTRLRHRNLGESHLFGFAPLVHQPSFHWSIIPDSDGER